MPISSGEFKIFATESANEYIVHHKGFIIHLGGRRGTKFEDRLPSLRTRVEELEHLNGLLPPNHMFMPRRAWHDEKRSTYTWDVDYMCPTGDIPIGTEEDLKSYLGDPRVLDDGQAHYWELRIAEYSLFKDDELYDQNHEMYYDRRYYFSMMLSACRRP